MRRSTLLLALALMLAVASPAFASEDDEKFFKLSQKLDLFKEKNKASAGYFPGVAKVPTGITGKPDSSHFLSKLIGRKILNIDGEDEVNGDFFLFKHKLDKIKKFLPTAGAYKIDPETEEIEEIKEDSIFQDKLDELKELLPSGKWEYDAETEDVDGKFFLPKYKLDKLKKLLPTGKHKYDADAQVLADADEKTFFLSHKLAKKFPLEGPKTGPKFGDKP